MSALPKSPIFIGGLFKSGTSLLRAMLGQHSTIASGLETYWFDLNWKNKDDKFWERINMLSKFYEIDEEETHNLVDDSANVAQFLNSFLAKYTARLSCQRWVEKTPGNIKHLDRIFQYWPDAKVIHIVRDPRDVFASLREAKKWDSLDKYVALWCDFFRLAEKFKAENGNNNGQIMEIRYEELVLDPVVTMKSVLKFLGEPWEDSVAQFLGNKEDYEKVLKHAGKASTTLERLRSPLTKSRVGIWKKVLEKEELEELENQIKKKGLLDLMHKHHFPN